MSIRKVIYLFFVLLAVSPGFAESATEKSPLAVNAPADEAGKKNDHRLPIVNPLFAPYQGQWYVELDATEQRSAYTATIPTQTYSGFTFSESKSRTDYTDIRVGGQVAYGIHDRLTVGVRTRFLADRQVQTSSTGVFTSAAPPVPSKTGMYSPDFVLHGRILGVNRDEWHLNLVGMYSPGSVGGLSGPQSDLQAGVMLGRNSGFLLLESQGLQFGHPRQLKAISSIAARLRCQLK